MTAPLQLVHSTASAPPPSLSDLVAREQRRARRRRLGWAAAAIAAILAIGAAVWLLRPKPVPIAARFRAQPVTSGAVVHEVSATGHLEPVSAVTIGAEVSGRVASVEVDFNARVKAGQVLARFDQTVLEAQAAQTRAMLAAAKAQAAQARFDAEHANRAAARAAQLFRQKGISEQEHEAATTAARLALARVDATAAQVAAQEAALAVARSNLAHAEVRAPSDGIVITRNVEPGQTFASMLQAPVLFTLAGDLERMEVVAAVDEADIADVRPGQPATFTVTAWPGRTFTGAVAEVRNSPIIVQDVVSYGVVVAVDNRDLALKPGMTASVRIRTAAVDATPRVPSAALHFTPPGHKRTPGEGAVFVLADGAPRKVAVQPGISDGELTAIAAGAIPDGAAVLVDLTADGRRAYGPDAR